MLSPLSRLNVAGQVLSPALAVPRARLQARSLVVPTALALIVLWAAALRLYDLPGQHGTLNVDEARLALVAQGVAEHGWPVLPSGKVYTRGLVATVPAAISIAMLGPSDFAARLPSVLTGTALVPLLFLYGSRIAGRGGGLLLALLGATYPWLVSVSRDAWFYSTFVFLWVLSLFLLDRAIARDSQRAVMLAAVAVALAFLACEFAVALLPAFGLAMLLWLRRGSSFRARFPTALLASLIVAAGVGLVLVMSLGLRSDTTVGPTGEIKDYLSIQTDAHTLSFYRRNLFPGQSVWILLGATLAGLALSSNDVRRRMVLPIVSALSLFLFVSFGIEMMFPRYGLAAAPALFVAAAVGISAIAYRLRTSLPPRFGAFATVVLYAVTLAALAQSLGLTKVFRNEPQTTWLNDLRQLGYQDGDIILTDAPTLTEHYLGGTDFWLRSKHFEKYVREDGKLLRDIHTGAPLIRKERHLIEMALQPNRGKRVWVVAFAYRPSWKGWIEDDLRHEIVKRTRRQHNSADGVILYELRT